MNIVFYEIEKDTKCETIWSLRCKPFNAAFIKYFNQGKSIVEWNWCVSWKLF